MGSEKKNLVALVTGGSGFLGRAIIEELLVESGLSNIAELRVFDLKEREDFGNSKINFIKGDICDYKMLKDACKNVDLVIHTAAIVDWGTKSKEEVYQVNVGGTKNIIKACKENRVPHLIYTSSLDAVFGGKSLRNIDESIPYPEKHVTMYCESKYLAENEILNTHDEKLKTCILRPADIYGERDPYHIDSLIGMAKTGFYVRLGNGKSKCQHVYVKNMAYAHVLVAKAPLAGNEKVNGNIYFITDGPGTNFFKFFDQVVVGAGYKVWPKNLWLPRWFAYSLGSVSEFIAFLISPFKKYNPKFSRFAVIYTCSDFTFSADKAKRDFGYQPKYAEAEALSRTIEYYRSQRASV